MHKLKFLTFVLMVGVFQGLFAQSDSLVQVADSVSVEDSLLVEQTRPDSIVTFTLAAVGDLMCHSPQFKYARVSGDSFNFVPCYEPILPVLQNADLTFGNLETVLRGPTVKYSGYPAFNSPDDFAVALKEVGFDFLSTTNNHSLDHGEKGVLRTLDQLDALGIGHTGTFSSEADRDSIRMLEVAGTKLAILAYTYGMNGRVEPAGKSWMVNEIDTLQMKNEVKRAKAEGADLVLVYYHFGVEYEHEPNADQRKVAAATMSAGADIILGSHPHVLQPMEYFPTSDSATLDTGFIAWSMGNFFSNQYWRYTDAGVVLQLEISRNLSTDSLWISEVNYLPTWVYRGKDSKKLHVIWPADAATEGTYLSAESARKMQEAFSDTKKTLNLYQSDFRLLENDSLNQIKQ